MTIPMRDIRITKQPEAKEDPERHLALRKALRAWADTLGYTEPAPMLKQPDIGRQTPGRRAKYFVGEAAPREWPGDHRFRDRVQHALAVTDPTRFEPGTLRLVIAYRTAQHTADWTDFLALMVAQFLDVPFDDMKPRIQAEKLEDGALALYVDLP